VARKSLGRGLDALIPSGGEGGEGSAGAVFCEVEKISAAALQPRKDFDGEALAELAGSIKSLGIIQPLLVRPKGEGYELIAGERRLRAAKMAGLSKVPVLVREVDDRTALELSLIENLQREDLGPLETAEAYRRLLKDFDYTQEELSSRLGKDRATIANQLRLLSLPDDIKADLAKGLISAGHARAILMAGSPRAMRALRDQVVAESLSVRETERRAQAGSGGKKPAAAKKKKSQAPLHVKEVQEKLIRQLGTKVRIIEKGKGGKIEIQFFSEEDLDRIYRRIVG